MVAPNRRSFEIEPMGHCCAAALPNPWGEISGAGTADGRTTPELAAQALISALESPMNDASSGIIAAGVSLLLGLSGWSRRAFE